jgi:hypothetical protein
MIEKPVVMMVVMVMVMMVVMVEAPIRPHQEEAVVMMVVVMMMVIELSELNAVPCRFSAPRILCFQSGNRIRNRIEKVPISGWRCGFVRRWHGSISCSEGCKCSGCAKQPGYLFIHESSERFLNLRFLPTRNDCRPLRFLTQPQTEQG